MAIGSNKLEKKYIHFKNRSKIDQGLDRHYMTWFETPLQNKMQHITKIFCHDDYPIYRNEINSLSTAHIVTDTLRQKQVVPIHSAFSVGDLVKRVKRLVGVIIHREWKSSYLFQSLANASS